MTEEEQQAERIAKIKETVAAASRFKLFQPVRCCQSPGMRMVDGVWENLPHDHADPNQHFNSRVIDWGYYNGAVQVATEITRNPHCSDWPWTENLVEPRTGWDWFTDREDDRVWQKVGSEIYFMWEEPGWLGSQPFDPITNDSYSVGELVKGVLEAPHVAYGDWIVRYEKKSTRLWITRTLNERQMWQRELGETAP